MRPLFALLDAAFAWCVDLYHFARAHVAAGKAVSATTHAVRIDPASAKDRPSKAKGSTTDRRGAVTSAIDWEATANLWRSNVG